MTILKDGYCERCGTPSTNSDTSHKLRHEHKRILHDTIRWGNEIICIKCLDKIIEEIWKNSPRTNNKGIFAPENRYFNLDIPHLDMSLVPSCPTCDQNSLKIKYQRRYNDELNIGDTIIRCENGGMSNQESNYGELCDFSYMIVGRLLSQEALADPLLFQYWKQLKIEYIEKRKAESLYNRAHSN